MSITEITDLSRSGTLLKISDGLGIREALSVQLPIVIGSLARRNEGTSPIVIGLSDSNGCEYARHVFSGVSSALNRVPDSIVRRIHLMLNTENLVPADHPKSIFGGMREHLNSLVKNNPMLNVHHVDVDLGAEDAVNSYNQLLSKLGGRLDIALHYVRPNGRIAGLRPHAPVNQHARGFVLLQTGSPAVMASSPFLIAETNTNILLMMGPEMSDVLSHYVARQQRDRTTDSCGCGGYHIPTIVPETPVDITTANGSVNLVFTDLSPTARD